MTASTTHRHAHADEPVQRVNRRPLAIALGITASFLVIEVIGGLLTNSLALLADAAHMLTDVIALALSLFAVWLAAKPATARRSFGYLRAEVLAALVNAGSLIAISIYIFWEAFQRLGDPPDVDSGPMLLVAIAGLGANAVSAWVLMRGGGHQDNLNTRGAYLHVVGDMLGSAGAILAAVIMLLTGWYLADPLLSAGIGVLILWSSWRLLRESADVLLEATPASIDPAEVRAAVEQVEGISGVHDLHIWTVTSGLIALSAHVDVTGARPWHETLLELTELLREQFGIAHVTVQPEDADLLPELYRACSLDSAEGQAACRVPFEPVGVDAHAGHRH